MERSLKDRFIPEHRHRTRQSPRDMTGPIRGRLARHGGGGTRPPLSQRLQAWVCHNQQGLGIKGWGAQGHCQVYGRVALSLTTPCGGSIDQVVNPSDLIGTKHGLPDLLRDRSERTESKVLIDTAFTREVGPTIHAKDLPLLRNRPA